VEVSLVYGIVLALVYVLTLALWSNILDCLRILQEYLDVSLGQRVVVIEKVVDATSFLESFGGSAPGLLHSLHVASIVVVVHITKRLAAM